MPRYFFTLADGGVLDDPDGEILTDDLAARRVAIEVMRETLANHDRHVLDGGPYIVAVRAEDGREVCRLTLRDLGSTGLN